MSKPTTEAKPIAGVTPPPIIAAEKPQTDAPSPNQPSPAYLRRFEGLARLYGSHVLALLNSAHFVVIGLGGVGSWAAEALARSGIGEITLIEMDEVCVSNSNRQSHALASTIGQAKNDVISARLKDINPEIRINQVNDFLDKNNISSLIYTTHDVVIDAMDAAHIKTALVAYCSAIKVRLIVCGSSGGKQDPSKITASDLAFTESDPMLAKIRTTLYRKYNFSRNQGRKFRVDAIYSKQQMVYPQPNGSVCTDKQALNDGVKLDCTNGFGSSVMVTGSFGFKAAQWGIERYLQKKSQTLDQQKRP